MEVGFSGDKGGDELGAPYISSSARDGEFVWEAGGHVHGVSHESESGHLVGELLPEEEKVWVGGVGRLEVVKGESRRHPFGTDG